MKPRLSNESKQRLATLMGVARFCFQWGFVPTVLYLGFRKGADEGQQQLTLLSLLWQ